MSGNNLAGEIPKSVSSFPESAFEANGALCGFPLEQCRVVSSDPTKPGAGAVGSPVNPNPGPVVSSNPSSIPAAPVVKKGGKPIGTVAIVAVIVGDFLVLVVISAIIYCCFWKIGIGKLREKTVLEGEKIVYSSSPYPVAQPGFERGKMVFFEGARRFELEDLLRASAEMLGKGGSGTAYKAVMEDGDEVAVKRMKVGRLRHGNVVPLKAYYFARDEKLLVYEYMPNGSLFWLLHGNRGPGRTPLDWTTRLKIAAGAARGLAFIHNSSCGPAKLVHGNIKSTNILLDKAGNARVSDFGLSMFTPPSSFSKSNGYRAPESSDPRKITQKADVYSFGVLLLELLTGKCPAMGDHVGSVIGYSGVIDLPRWVQSVVREEWTAEVFDLELMRYKDIEEEMVGLLQIAMACTSAALDQRPKMNRVVKMIEEIRGVEVSPSHDASDSVSDSHSVSEDTCGVSQ